MSQCLIYDDFFPKSNPGQVGHLTLKKTKFESGLSESHMFKICQTVRYFLKTHFLLQIFANVYFNVASLFNMKSQFYVTGKDQSITVEREVLQTMTIIIHHWRPDRGYIY